MLASQEEGVLQVGPCKSWDKVRVVRVRGRKSLTLLGCLKARGAHNSLPISLSGCVGG